MQLSYKEKLIFRWLNVICGVIMKGFKVLHTRAPEDIEAYNAWVNKTYNEVHKETFPEAYDKPNRAKRAGDGSISNTTIDDILGDR